MLDARYLVAGCAVVLSEFGFNNDLRVILVGNNEVWGLVEAGYALGASGFAESDASTTEQLFDRVLDEIADQLTDRISR